MSQIFINGIENLEKLLNDLNTKKFLLVCDASFRFLNIRDTIENIAIPHTVFDAFTSNPLHDDAEKGVKLLLREKCDVIVAVGGGSSLDVAKCIKLDSGISIPIIAVPTTAGTGSESTRHIVVYRNGSKESLGNESVIPDYVLFEPGVLKTLPLYQKKCTMLDALCQGIESYWSVNADVNSRIYSEKAMRLIKANMDSYIKENDESAAEKIMEGANYSGRAINISQTTAAHAMSYKLTSMYNLPHGHAVAICLPEVWSMMLKKDCEGKLTALFCEIAKALGRSTPQDAVEWFKNVLSEYDIKYPSAAGDREHEITLLAESVNPVRLKNNPVQFTESELKEMYGRILK